MKVKPSRRACYRASEKKGGRGRELNPYAWEGEATSPEGERAGLRRVTKGLVQKANGRLSRKILEKEGAAHARGREYSGRL